MSDALQCPLASHPSPARPCRRENGQEGYVPANYMQEAEPAKVSKVTKQKEMMMVPVKVKRKKMEKRKVTKSKRRSNYNPSRGGTRASGGLVVREGRVFK